MDYRKRKLVGFFSNFGAWLIISTFLFILNMISSPEHWWFLYPMLGWGVGVAFHALSLFKTFIFADQRQSAAPAAERYDAPRALPESDAQPITENRRKVEMSRRFDDSEFV